MPTYEYQCAACNHKFEEFQSIKAKPTRKCPKCGKMKVDRLLSAGAGMIFKGSGFYITDYRSENYKSGAKAESTGAVSPTTSGGNGETSGKSDAAKSADAPASGATAGVSKPEAAKSGRDSGAGANSPSSSAPSNPPSSTAKSDPKPKSSRK